MSDEPDVSIVAPDGKLGTVPKASLQDALAQGYKMPSGAQSAEIAQRLKYGSGLGTETKAAAEGAARGLTFGASDWALSKSGLVDKEALAERKERNPWAAGAGEAAGIAGGLLLPTGWVGAGVKGAAAAGEVAARGAASLLTRAGVEGGTLASRALASGVKAATGSAVEGALYGAGQGISETALGDPSDVAEKILGHATMGALLGGTLGGAAGALGGVGSKALERFAKPAADIVDGAPSVARQALDAEGTTKPANLISQFLEDVAGEQALRSAGLPKSAYKKLDRMVKVLPDGDNAVLQDAAEEMSLHKAAADIMRKNRLAQAGDTFEDVGNRVRNHINDASGRASKFIAETDAASEAPLFNVRSFADKLRDFGKQFEDRPEMAAQHRALLKRVEDYEALADKRAGTVRLTESEAAQRKTLLDKIDDLSSNPSRDSTAAQDKIARLKDKLNSLPEPAAGNGRGNITLAEAEAMKRDFNSVMEKTGSDAASLIGKQSRGIFNRQIEETAQKAATSPEAYAAWKLAKREQEALLPVLKGNENKLQALSTNRSFSLTDYIGGGSVVGALGAHPLGLAAGVAAAGANKLMREYGSAAISDIANRAAQGLGASRGAQALQLMHLERTKNVMTQRLQSAADGIAQSLGKSPSPVKSLAVAGVDKLAMLPEDKADSDKQVTNALHNRITEITNLAENPMLMQQRLTETMSDLPQFAPRLTAQMQFTASTAVQYLADKVPKNPYADAPLDIRQAWRPPTTQMVAFERTVRAIHDPMGTIEEFKDGHVTKEAADALRAVYPGMYGKLVEHIVPAIARAPKVPLQRRLQLANMLGVELDVFTSPALGGNLQQMYGQTGQQAAAPPRPAVSKNYRAEQSQTPLQRALSDGA